MPELLVVVPFLIAIGILLRCELKMQRQLKEVRKIADAWNAYLEDFDTERSDKDVRHGPSVSDSRTDYARFYRCLDDVLASTER